MAERNTADDCDCADAAELALHPRLAFALVGCVRTLSAAVSDDAAPRETQVLAAYTLIDNADLLNEAFAVVEAQMSERPTPSLSKD